MTEMTPLALAPETLAELRRLYEAAFTVAAPENEWEEWTSKAAEAFPALLDAAAERDRLAGLLDEPRRSGCAVEIAGVRIAPCDERGQTADMLAADMLAADRPRRELAYMAEARDNARAEVERLSAQLDAETGGESCGSVSAWLLDIYRDGAAAGWDACLKSLRYEDATPVEIVSFNNPYRTGEE